MRKYVVLSGILLLLFGCSTKIHMYKSYEGKAKPDNSIAKLIVPGEVAINSIDGKSGYYPTYISDISPYDGAVVGLLPGKHLVNVKYFKSYRSLGSYTSSAGVNLSLQAKAGVRYAIYPVTHYVQNSLGGTSEKVSFSLVKCGEKKELMLRQKRKKKLGNKYLPMCENNKQN